MHHTVPTRGFLHSFNLSIGISMSVPIICSLLYVLSVIIIVSLDITIYVVGVFVSDDEHLSLFLF